MNSTEKLALIERVNHASGDQAKRALQSMILKCTVTQSTIARAIKDAIERHTPTPSIVYEEPEPRDDGDSAPASNNHKKDQSDRDQNDVVVLSAASEEHHDSAHDDIGAVKSKAEKKGKRKGSGHHNSHDNPDLSKKKKFKKIKHASKLRAETEQTSPEVSLGGPSKQAKPSVIDLVTSSDAETHDAEQPEEESLDKRVSDDDLDLVTSSEDEPFHLEESKDQTPNDKIPSDDLENGNLEDRNSTTDSSNDEGSKSEQQNHAVVGGVRAAQEGSDVKTTQTNARNGDECRRAHSVTISIARPSNQRDDYKMGSAGLDKKRKAPEPPVEEVHTNQPAKSASDIHLVKRPKQNHPQDPKKPLDDWKCRKCGLLFPSVTQLLDHHLVHREDATATNSRHHNSSTPANNLPRQFEHPQKAGNTAGDGLTEMSHNTVQLPSRPPQRGPADHSLSRPPPSFVQQPADRSFAASLTPSALASLVPGIHSSSSGPIRRPVPKHSSNVSLGDQLRIPKRESLRPPMIHQSRSQALYQCEACKKWFQESDNAVHACTYHPGACKLFKMPHGCRLTVFQVTTAF